MTKECLLEIERSYVALKAFDILHKHSDKLVITPIASYCLWAPRTILLTRSENELLYGMSLKLVN